MTLLWMEGFETHAHINQAARKYATATGGINDQAGRVFGTSASPTSGSLILVTPTFRTGAQSVVGFGLGMRINAQVTALNSGGNGLYLELGASEQLHVEVESNAGSFELRIMRGATEIFKTAETFAYAVWHHFEFRFTVDNVAGTYEIRHNEASVGSGTGVNLADTGSPNADVFSQRWGFTSSNFLLDDVFVWDTTAAEHAADPIDFVGDATVEGVLPDADGTPVQWTPSAGSNFQNVDDPANVGPDDAGAGGFNESDTVGQIDDYSMADLANSTGTIIGVQLSVQLALDVAGSRTVNLRAANNTVDTPTVDQTTYSGFEVVMPSNPSVAGAWDLSNFNSAEFGVEVAS